VDVVARCFEAVTGVSAVLEEAGEQFADLTARRLGEVGAGTVEASTRDDAGACVAGGPCEYSLRRE
jgi:hypothetical protein